MEDIVGLVARQWADLVGRVGGLFTFRPVLQPIAAAVLAIRSGMKDARGGRRPYFWAMYADPVHRRELLRQGWKDVSRVFVIAVIIDVIYQLIVLHWIYPGPALIVAAILALRPYLLMRGLVNRIARRWPLGAAPAEARDQKVPTNAARLVLTLAGCGVLSGCLPLFGAGDRRPTLDELRHASITGIAGQPITLKDGVYDEPPIQPGGASRLRVTLWADLVAFGDLDGVPPEEAASLLSTNAGGSGSIVYLAVFRTHGGRVINAGTAMVGDRTRVCALGIVDRTVILDVVEAGPTDAMCCPSRLARKSYGFHDGTLTLVSSVATGTLSLAALAGREWTLVSLHEQPLPYGAAPPTIIFDGTRVSGFGGCNRYTGQVSEKTPGTIAVGPLAATKMACPSPAMEVEEHYIATLGTVSQYTFVAGRLLLSGANGGTSQRLMFERGLP